jgi:plasmid stabilization system protein ParE
MSDMPLRTVEFHRLAQRELEKAKRWYRRHGGSQRVLRFLQALDHVLQQISTSAELGSPYLQRFRWMRMKRFPYLLYYEIRDPQPVLVYATAHAQRRLGYWLRRVRP